jgi:uncharacterized Zn finger protein
MSTVDWTPYVTAADRRQRARKIIAESRERGQLMLPLRVSGRAVASSFWGQAWCANLESYSDFANRLPRGRSYLRGGAVVDLQIKAGQVSALVQGSRLYRVTVNVSPVPKPRWQDMVRRCSGALGSLVELLSGRIARSVLEVVSERGRGLLPTPAEIDLSCTCPDWATMCKHVAAVLYGVGARLDLAPKLLFTLRQVDPTDLLLHAGEQLTPPLPAGASSQLLVSSTADLQDLFGIDLGEPPVSEPAPAPAPEPPAPAPPAAPQAKRRSPARSPQAAQDSKQLVALRALLRKMEGRPAPSGSMARPSRRQRP